MALKILLHGLNFAPEEIGIGKYSGEMVAELADQGVDVCVVTTPPYYPHWKVTPGYSGIRYTKESELVTGDRKNVDGDTAGKVEVIRCPLWVPSRVNGLKRIIHLASFGLSSIPVVLWKAVTTRPDVIMTVEPASFCMPTTWLAARLCGAKAWLHIQDLEVDAAFELGVIRQPLLKRCVLAVEAFMMRRFDRASSISPNMMMKLVQKSVCEERMVLFPNWVDCDVMKPLCQPDSQEDLENSLTDDADGEVHRDEELIARLRRKFGIPLDKCVAMYAGNIGAKQGLNIIVDAAKMQAKRVQDSFEQSTPTASSSPADHVLPDIHFVICGDGAAFPGLLEAAEGVDNVQLLPVQPVECFNELMNCADMHLLPQRSGAADLVMPSKLTGMLATGRPVVACASPGTQVADVVAGHGVVVPPGDIGAFCDAIVCLAEDPQLRRKLGQASREYAVSHLGRESILRRFLRDLADLADFCFTPGAGKLSRRAVAAPEDDEATRLRAELQVPAVIGMNPPTRSEITNSETR